MNSRLITLSDLIRMATAKHGETIAYRIAAGIGRFDRKDTWHKVIATEPYTQEQIDEMEKTRQELMNKFPYLRRLHDGSDFQD